MLQKEILEDKFQDQVTLGFKQLAQAQKLWRVVTGLSQQKAIGSAHLPQFQNPLPCSYLAQGFLESLVFREEKELNYITAVNQVNKKAILR